MMILKNKLCGSASSARQGLSDPTVMNCFRFRYRKHVFRKININKSKLRSFAPILRFDTETATFKVTNTLINDLLTPQIVKSNCEFDGNTSF